MCILTRVDSYPLTIVGSGSLICAVSKDDQIRLQSVSSLNTAGRQILALTLPICLAGSSDCAVSS